MQDTRLLFRDDPYLRDCEATIVEVDDRGGIVLDRTVFYAASGGQPGDTGVLILSGMTVPLGPAVHGPDKTGVVHVPAMPENMAAPGMSVRAEIDWDRRYAHMRMHTALHLLCALVLYPVTGGSIGAEDSRLDFDIDEAGAVDRDDLTARLNALIAEDHPVTTRWITDEELAANPGLVRTMSVRPPAGSGRVRLVGIGDDGGVDLQPCGGTHVRSTGEIGRLAVTRIEKKGRQNRRIRLAFEDA